MRYDADTDELFMTRAEFAQFERDKDIRCRGKQIEEITVDDLDLMYDGAIAALALVNKLPTTGASVNTVAAYTAILEFATTVPEQQREELNKCANAIDSMMRVNCGHPLSDITVNGPIGGNAWRKRIDFDCPRCGAPSYYWPPRITLVEE
jgi:hypothetical protein